MNKKIYILSVVYFALTFLDIFITYLSTPDLTFEGNPLVTVFHLGWGALILVNLIGFLIYVFCCYYCFEKYRTIVCEAANVGEYTSKILFNRPDKPLWVFYIVPENWTPVRACLAYEYVCVLPIARVITIFEWYVWHSNAPFKDYYIALKNLFPYERLDIAIIIVLAFTNISLWFNREYSISEKERNLCT